MDAAYHWRTEEATVFRTEYPAIHAVTWLPEVYGRYRLWYLLRGVREVLSGCDESLKFFLGNEFNVRDLYPLTTVMRWKTDRWYRRVSELQNDLRMPVR